MRIQRAAICGVCVAGGGRADLEEAEEEREKGKARTRFEFGVKVSLATTNRPAPRGQFVLGARTLPGNPFHGHTLDPVIPAKKEPIRSRVPLRRFRFDARHDILRCPQGRIGPHPRDGAWLGGGGDAR